MARKARRPSPACREVIDRTEATLLAREKLKEMMASNAWRDGPPTGDFGDKWPAYTWQKEVVEVDAPSAYEVRLTVRWQSRVGPQSVSVSTVARGGND
jgi:hypothetical protein